MKVTFVPAPVMIITVAAVVRAQRGVITKRARKQRRRWEPNMTASLTCKLRQATLMLAFAASVSALSSSESFAFSAEAQQMCTGDAFRLCSSDIPNIAAITSCMVKHRTQLSSGCRTVMDRDLAAKSGKVAAAQ
jgi:hypothetical protein